MRVIRIQFKGTDKGGMILPATEKKGILEEVEMFIDELAIDDGITLTAEEMTKEEVDALPEFTGW